MRVSIWDDEKVLQMDNGDDYTTMQMYLMLQNCTLNIVKMVNLMSIFTTKKTGGVTLRYMSTMEEVEITL